MASPMQPSATTQSDISKLAKKMAAKQQAAQNHRGLSSLPEDDPRVAYDEGSACLCSREPDLIREVGIIKKVHEVIDEDGKGAVSVASCYMCRAGEGILQGSDCEACPTGSWSPAGSSNCDVRAHYYRWRDESELYLCPAHDDACRGQRGDHGAGDALCARRATGPLCMRCERGHHRVVTRNGSARCMRCGDWGSIAGVYVYLVVFVGLAVIWLAWAR